MLEPEDFYPEDDYDFIQDDDDCHEDLLIDYTERKGQSWEQYWQGVMDGTQPL